MSKYGLLDDNSVKNSFRYKRFMRDGSVQEFTAVVRSRRSNKGKDNGNKESSS